MIAQVLARSTRLARPTNMLRRGGHGPVSYNEPGGYLFNEKVALLYECYLFNLTIFCIFRSVLRKTGKTYTMPVWVVASF